MSGPARAPSAERDGHDARAAEVIAASLHAPDRFAGIFDRYYAEIHRYVDRRLGADAADDIAAETFLVAFRKRAGFDAGRGTPRSWLYGIATRLVARHRREEVRRFRAMARLDGPAAVDGHADRVAEAVTAAGAGLGPALAALRADDRDVLLLVALGGLSYPEVAEALGVRYGTVCSRLSRARRSIRAALGGTDPTGLTGDDEENDRG
ncbi:RNA polymerase sigma factor [Actinomadura rubrisoli]|uniref:RNA polymerase sigma factor n=1 Tax=Actinomadura rubrisoli TaxID=2530368 RepID=A0A4R5A1M6_9ACTN|nr:RNA polymerase sigma factor [Actinomadura rubrisoli]TDD64676.1 RNA polymerase sigma factor [Actinomadura rubrisoli]